MTADEIRDYGENNSLAYRLSSDGLLTYDADGNPVPGSGSGTDIAYNPDIVLGPEGSPRPADSTLHHELGHAENNAYGNNRGGETRTDGYHNEEEFQVIEGRPELERTTTLKIAAIPTAAPITETATPYPMDRRFHHRLREEDDPWLSRYAPASTQRRLLSWCGRWKRTARMRSP